MLECALCTKSPLSVPGQNDERGSPRSAKGDSYVGAAIRVWISYSKQLRFCRRRLGPHSARCLAAADVRERCPANGLVVTTVAAPENTNLDTRSTAHDRDEVAGAVAVQIARRDYIIYRRLTVETYHMKHTRRQGVPPQLSPASGD